MKKETKQKIIAVTIPLVVGGVSALLTMGSMKNFERLNQPPLSPPTWIFPVAWTILYILMGYASYLVWAKREETEYVSGALKVYAIQLAFNFCWSIIFFNLGWYYFALGWLIIMWLLIINMMKRFFMIEVTAGYLIAPYFLWVTFAAYLNLGIALLN